MFPLNSYNYYKSLFTNLQGINNPEQEEVFEFAYATSSRYCNLFWIRGIPLPKVKAILQNTNVAQNYKMFSYSRCQAWECYKFSN